jgi:hypothetical protein
MRACRSGKGLGRGESSQSEVVEVLLGWEVGVDVDVDMGFGEEVGEEGRIMPSSRRKVRKEGGRGIMRDLSVDERYLSYVRSRRNETKEKRWKDVLRMPVII